MNRLSKETYKNNVTIINDYIDELRTELNFIIEELYKNGYSFDMTIFCTPPLNYDNYGDVTFKIDISRNGIKDYFQIGIVDFYIKDIITFDFLISEITILISNINDEEKKQEERIKLLNGRTEQQYKIDCLMEKINRRQ